LAGWIVLWLLGRAGDAVLPVQSLQLASGIAVGLTAAFFASIAAATRHPTRWRLFATALIVCFLLLIGVRSTVNSLLVGVGGLVGFLWGDGITRGAQAKSDEDHATTRGAGN